MQNLISISDLSKQYVTENGVVTPVLKDINIDVLKGEFVSIMGPSGSGKSTFMNILGCLDIQTSGKYFLDGKDIETMDDDQLSCIRNSMIGFIFQGFNLLSRRTALENIELPLLYSGINKSERKARALDMLDKVGLKQFANSFPNELSGGQQQRVALARAIANSPKVILADEPTGNLDTATSIEVMKIFTKLNESGITIVLVTHEADIARYAKRLIRFRDGNIIYDGPIDGLGVESYDD
jgi:putative ABC transport system ATP-binding protein